MGMSKIPKPVFIQKPIPEYFAKTLDIAILHRFFGLNQLQLDALTVRPLIN